MAENRVPIQAELRYCPTHVSEADYKAFEAIDLATDNLADLLSRNGHASWTVCPACHLDDFTHFEGCRMAGSAGGWRQFKVGPLFVVWSQWRLGWRVTRRPKLLVIVAGPLKLWLELPV